MESNVFKQFEKQFSDEWKCSCGNSFEVNSVEIVSKTKNSLLARYSCQVCGREQMFAISGNGGSELIETSPVGIPGRLMTSDDVLDIRKQLQKISWSQIKSLDKRKARARVTTSKVSRR